MKVDRQEIIGLVTAIDIWLSTDHDKRSKEQDARYAALTQGLENIEGVSCEVRYQKNSHTLSNLHVTCSGWDAAEIACGLDVLELMRHAKTGAVRKPTHFLLKSP